MRTFRPRPRAGGDDLLPRPEERRLARAWRDNRDHKARDKIIAAYQKMAVSLAMKAARSGLPIEDLVQEASIGLMAALDRFDPELGNGFGTFARYHVISRLQIYTLETNADPGYRHSTQNDIMFYAGTGWCTEVSSLRRRPRLL